MKNLLALIVLLAYGGTAYYIGTQNLEKPEVIIREVAVDRPVAACSAPFPTKRQIKHDHMYTFVEATLEKALRR